MKKLRILLALCLFIAVVAAILLTANVAWSVPLFGLKNPSFMLGLWIAMNLATAMSIYTKMKKEPNSEGSVSPQRETGPRLNKPGE
jgi:hypothetical protein